MPDRMNTTGALMKMRWLLVPAIIGAAVGLDLFRNHWRLSAVTMESTLTVMSYNVGDDRPTKPSAARIAAVIQRAGVPDLLLLQDNNNPIVISQLARQLGLPYYLSGRETPPIVNASLLSRYPLSGPRTLSFDNEGVKPGMLCANVRIRTNTLLACSLYMPSLSVTARQVVRDHAHEYRDVIRLLWNETFHENARSRNVSHLLDWLGNRQAQSVIVGGDFNTFPQSRAIRNMQRHFEDALWLTMDNFTGTYLKLDFPIRPRIDYLFHSADISVAEAAVVRDSAGDHYPVRARMILPAAAIMVTSP